MEQSKIIDTLETYQLTATSTATERKCLLITRKIMIPPPDSRDPSKGPPYLAKTTFPLTAGTHQLNIGTQGSASEQKNDLPLDTSPTYL